MLASDEVGEIAAVSVAIGCGVVDDEVEHAESDMTINANNAKR